MIEWNFLLRGSNHWKLPKLPKMHFKSNLFFFNFFGRGGHFTLIVHLKILSSLVRPSGNCLLSMVGSRIFDWGGPRIDKARDDYKMWPYLI